MNPAYKTGHYASLLAFIACAGYGVVQILQVLKLVNFPLGDQLIYGFSLGIAIPFFVSMLCLHYAVPEERKIWSHGALAFAAIYCTFASLIYVVQLFSVLPAQVRGTAAEALIVKPQSFFWTVDALAYIFMGIATLFAVPAFSSKGKERRVKWFFLAHGIMVPIISAIYFYPHFSIALLLLGTPWIITACGSMLALNGYFERKMKYADHLK